MNRLLCPSRKPEEKKQPKALCILEVQTKGIYIPVASCKAWHLSKTLMLPPLAVTMLSGVPVKVVVWLPAERCVQAGGTEPPEVSRRLTQIAAIPITMHYRLLDFVAVMSFKYSQKRIEARWPHSFVNTDWASKTIKSREYVPSPNPWRAAARSYRCPVRLKRH